MTVPMGVAGRGDRKGLCKAFISDVCLCCRKFGEYRKVDTGEKNAGHPEANTDT